jgi:inhibitor of KinA
MLKSISQISEQAFLLDFGENIDIKTNNFVIYYSNLILERINLNNCFDILNCIPSYNKILIHFDPNTKKKIKILEFLNSIFLTPFKLNSPKKMIEIPICYEDDYSLDLKDISKQTNLSKTDIINFHLNTIFHVYMIGFMPGLPFMGDINLNLSVKRKLSPRIDVPKGSVGIVDNLCVIYPNSSPGGWNIIGRTPIELFLKNKKYPALLSPGNKVKFKSISKKEFESSKNEN